MKALRSTVILVAGVLALGGCATSNPDDPTRTGGGFDRPVYLTIQNTDFRDAAIYVRWNAGSRRRIGMVTGKTSESFEIRTQGYRLFIEADLIAGGSVFFEPVDVFGGDQLQLVIMIQG